MKKRGIFCIISVVVLIFVVGGVLLILNGAMASADSGRRKFSTNRDASDLIIGDVEESIPDGEKNEVQEQVDDKYQTYTSHHSEYDSHHSDEYSTVSDCYSNGCSLDDYRDYTVGQQIALFASYYQGIRYEYGGETLPDAESLKTVYTEKGEVPIMPIIENGDCGVDCSGFVKAVFNYYKIALPRTCKEQAKEGKEVKIKDIEPGDIIFYGADANKITHCGIYLEDGKVVHSSAKAKAVIISDMNYRKIIAVRRVV